MCWALNVDWDSTGSMLAGLGGLAAGGATIALAVFAHKGLSAWRTQLTGTRKVEAGETLLTRIYEADEVLKHITAPFLHAGELDAVERLEGEDDEEYRLRANYESIRNRYVEHQAVFNSLRTACFAAKATLGHDVYVAAIEVVKFPTHILHSAATLRFREQVLNRLTRQGEIGIAVSHAQYNEALERWTQAHTYFYGLDEDEKLDARRIAAVAQVESLTRAAIGVTNEPRPRSNEDKP